MNILVHKHYLPFQPINENHFSFKIDAMKAKCRSISEPSDIYKSGPQYFVEKYYSQH